MIIFLITNGLQSYTFILVFVLKRVEKLHFKTF